MLCSKSKCESISVHIVNVGLLLNVKDVRETSIVNASITGAGS